MKVILFGNRGSRPIGASPDNPFERYGGDTTAIGIIGDRGELVALDTGSAFWKWPYTLNYILGRDSPYNLSIFYTHYHDDHTMGIPQSPLLFQKGNTINFYGPDFQPGLRAVFNAKASQPSNPDLARAYQATMHFHGLKEDSAVRNIALDSGMKVSWMSVPHGNEKSLAYRVDEQRQALCFVSDTHHVLDSSGRPVLNQELVNFLRGADALIYDSHFSDAEFAVNPAFYGGVMGHSTGEHGVRLAAAAGVPLLISHHHDPNKTDSVLDAQTHLLQAYGRARGVAVIAAQPSLCLNMSLTAEQMVSSVKKQDTQGARYEAIRP